jgi:hypothetical protein
LTTKLLNNLGYTTQMLNTTTQPPQVTDSYDHSLMSLSFATFLLAIVLFVSSLFLPVFITQTNDIQGYWVLAMGWLGFIAFQFAWYASPFAILAVYVSRRSPQLGLLLSVVAILMASEAFLFTEVPFGRNDKVLDYGLGFYLWYLCFYLVSLSILLRLVVWGRVEEAASPIAEQSFQQNLDVINTEIQLQTPTTSKVIRVIIPKEERVGRKKVSKSGQLRNWGEQIPPPLPRKNIYQSGKSEAIKVAVNVQPPPIPMISNNPKRAFFSKPPPLPKWYRTVASPPPLPKSANKDLSIAPFLKK